MRQIILPQVAGVTTDPPAGTYHVESQHDFIFTLTLAVPFAAAPVVRTPLPKGFHAVVLSGGKTVKIMNYES
ncbi:MAG: hypothetical protein LBL33_08305 [Tannerella sp.]|jgi:hypothetical protein|nr:hypothetical protein [Tannerella sp.]